MVEVVQIKGRRRRHGYGSPRGKSIGHAHLERADIDVGRARIGVHPGEVECACTHLGKGSETARQTTILNDTREGRAGGVTGGQGGRQTSAVLDAGRTRKRGKRGNGLIESPQIERPRAIDRHCRTDPKSLIGDAGLERAAIDRRRPGVGIGSAENRRPSALLDEAEQTAPRAIHDGSVESRRERGVAEGQRGIGGSAILHDSARGRPIGQGQDYAAKPIGSTAAQAEGRAVLDDERRASAQAGERTGRHPRTRGDGRRARVAVRAAERQGRGPAFRETERTGAIDHRSCVGRAGGSVDGQSGQSSSPGVVPDHRIHVSATQRRNRIAEPRQVHRPIDGVGGVGAKGIGNRRLQRAQAVDRRRAGVAAGAAQGLGSPGDHEPKLAPPRVGQRPAVSGAPRANRQHPRGRAIASPRDQSPIVASQGADGFGVGAEIERARGSAHGDPGTIGDLIGRQEVDDPSAAYGQVAKNRPIRDRLAQIQRGRILDGCRASVLVCGSPGKGERATAHHQILGTDRLPDDAIDGDRPERHSQFVGTHDIGDRVRRRQGIEPDISQGKSRGAIGRELGAGGGDEDVVGHRHGSGSPCPDAKRAAFSIDRQRTEAEGARRRVVQKGGRASQCRAVGVIVPGIGEDQGPGDPGIAHRQTPGCAIPDRRGDRRRPRRLEVNRVRGVVQDQRPGAIDDVARGHKIELTKGDGIGGGDGYRACCALEKRGIRAGRIGRVGEAIGGVRPVRGHGIIPSARPSLENAVL